MEDDEDGEDDDRDHDPFNRKPCHWVPKANEKWTTCQLRKTLKSNKIT